MREMLIALSAISVIQASSLVPSHANVHAAPRRITVRVTKLDGMSESGDCVVFFAAKRRYYVYAFGDDGERHAHLVINSFHEKRSICLELNSKTKGLVDRVFPECGPSTKK